MPERNAATRRYARIRSENPVHVRRLSPGVLEGIAKTRVVGLGGCMFVSGGPIGTHSAVELAINLRGRMVNAVGKVVYEIPKADGAWEVGVEFVSISEEDRRILEGLFSTRASLEE
jgi:hypothetical protein